MLKVSEFEAGISFIKIPPFSITTSSTVTEAVTVTLFPFRIEIVLALKFGVRVAVIHVPAVPVADDSHVAVAFQFPVALDLKKSVTAETQGPVRLIVISADKLLVTTGALLLILIL